MCIHARYLYCVFSSKTHKVNQKSEIFELLFLSHAQKERVFKFVQTCYLHSLRYFVAREVRFAYVR